MSLESHLLGLWYGPAWRSLALWPLEALYALATRARRRAYRSGLLRQEDVGAPVIIVGNLTVGGTGKTPIASWLAGELRRCGLATAIVLRGYGGEHSGEPLRVTRDTDPAIAGDEAVLHAHRGAELVFVDGDRVAAARAAVAAGAQVVVSDDGLQHLRLARQYEIVVIDAERGLGNGHLLPAGPLREPARRLDSADAVVVTDRGARRTEQVAGLEAQHAIRVRLMPGEAVNLLDGTRRALASFRGRRVHALAGIGHPSAFFAALRAEGLDIEAHALPDHATLDDAALSGAGDAIVLMTQKDAVKCRRFAHPGWWYVDLEVEFEPPSAAADLVARVLDVARRAPDVGGRVG
jgi:tetraacyldisaccharide 4'-kinase